MYKKTDIICIYVELRRIMLEMHAQMLSLQRLYFCFLFPL